MSPCTEQGATNRTPRKQSGCARFEAPSISSFKSEASRPAASNDLPALQLGQGHGLVKPLPILPCSG